MALENEELSPDQFAEKIKRLYKQYEDGEIPGFVVVVRLDNGRFEERIVGHPTRDKREILAELRARTYLPH